MVRRISRAVMVGVWVVLVVALTVYGLVASALLTIGAAVMWLITGRPA